MDDSLIKKFTVLIGAKDQELIDMVAQIKGVDAIYDGTVFQSYVMRGLKLLIDYANAKYVQLYQAFLDLAVDPEQLLIELDLVESHNSLVKSYALYTNELEEGQLTVIPRKPIEAKKAVKRKVMPKKLTAEQSNTPTVEVEAEEHSQSKLNVINLSGFGL